jgi:peptide/nickel transport system substrate-binding protein
MHGMHYWERWLFFLLLAIIVLSITGLIYQVNKRFSHAVPRYGGSVTEGVLGTPRFINPVLAQSDIDNDMVKIIYSGLLRKADQDGNIVFIPDLAQSYTVSPDGKTYTFTLKDSAVFHDRKPVAAEDVVFTLQSIQNVQLRSPLVNEWLGISVKALDEKTVEISLPQPFSGFLESTTLGILPKHIWGSMAPEEFMASIYNSKPIGTGPYKVESIQRNKNGIPVVYNFESFRKFTLEKPLLKKFSIRLYPNGQELLRGYERNDFTLIAGLQSYEVTEQNSKFIQTEPLPRMFGLFMNETKNAVLTDPIVVQAINNSIDVNEIIRVVFQGNARPIYHPLPELPQEKPLEKTTSKESIESSLEKAGWELNPETNIRSKGTTPLSFTISTADTPELKYTAQIIQQHLKTIGIITELHVFPISDLETTVIKPRSFEVLLFGQLIRNDADLYAFWHSSQKSDPGLNITGYTQRDLDSNLEKIFSAPYSTERLQLLEEIQKNLEKAPVIWLYQPYFIYTFKKPVYGITLNNLISKHDRYNTIYQWYTKTDMIWNVFKK